MGVSFVPPELQQPATISEEHPLPDIAPAADEEQQDDLQDVLIKKKMKGMHPKGSTDACYEELKRKFILATNYASIKFSEVKTLSGSADLKRGVFDSIIEEAKTKFNLPANYMINKETVRTRVKRGNLTANHKGTPSPMEKVEMHALDIICQMAKLRQPLTPQEALKLMNLLIGGTVTATEVNEWKAKHIPQHENENEEGETKRLGLGYWHGFMR